MRRPGFLNIALDAVTKDGLYVQNPGKRSRPILYKWNDELRELVNKIVEYSKQRKSNFFFSNEDGTHISQGDVDIEKLLPWNQ